MNCVTRNEPNLLVLIKQVVYRVCFVLVRRARGFPMAGDASVRPDAPPLPPVPQALVKGRAEGRLEIISGDAKQATPPSPARLCVLVSSR